MSVLVIGGTGTVGREAVSRLLSRGQTVRVMTRSAEKAKNLPDGVQGAVGELDDPLALQGAMEGIERLFLITPLSPTEAEQGLTVVRIAKEMAINQLVYLSIHNVEKAPHIPHFKSKIEIQQAIYDLGIAYTLIMPNNFYQNDYEFRRAIMEHDLYPQPIGDVGLNRVDVRDVAEAGVNALIYSQHKGQRYPLVGPDRLTGQAVAEAYSYYLGREVRYGGNDLEAWSTRARETLPTWMVHDLKIMYRFFQEQGLLASEEDFVMQERILESPPRTFEAFVQEAISSWQD